MNLGAAEYLVKPVSQEQLQRSLNQVVLPGPEAAAQDRLGQDSDQEAGSGPVEWPLVLVAEDDNRITSLLVDYLLANNYQVIVAQNGAEALKQARAQIPDIIMMDIQMPEMDGLEAIRHLRADSDLAAIPIIALTALAMPGDRERCLAAGANDYLSKPINLELLAQKIETQLEQNSSAGLL